MNEKAENNRYCPYAESGPMCDVDDDRDHCNLCLKGMIADALDSICVEMANRKG